MKQLVCHTLLALLFSGCVHREVQPVNMDDLTTLKNEFLQQIHTSAFDEGPFSVHYTFRTIFFSKEVISLFGELTVHDRLPHGWKYYEGKTLCMINNRYEVVTLDDLFTTDEQKEFLRKICEKSLKKGPLTYFTGQDPLRTTLTQEDIHTFVMDDQNLIIIFQPYSVGGGADGPFLVKIPFVDLKGHWEGSHPIHALLQKAIKSGAFTSSWDLQQFYDHVMNE